MGPFNRYSESASPRRGALHRPAFHLALIALLGLLVYSNTFDAPFQFDEKDLIENNAAVKGMRLFDPFRWASGPEPQYLRSRYVGYLTFALDYRAHGLDVWGYHAVNLSIHVANAMLLYVLVMLTLRTPALRDSALAGRAKGAALLAGALFVAHPVQTEAVTYVFQRHASLAALFCLAAITAYAGSRLARGRVKGTALYALSVLSMALAMKSKENAFTFPLVVALYEVLFFTDNFKFQISNLRLPFLRLLPLLLTMLIVPLSLVGAGRPVGEIIGGMGEASRGFEGVERGDYLATQARAVATYSRLLFLPVNQNVDYDYPLYTSPASAPVVLSVVFLAAIIGLAVFLLWRSRHGGGAMRAAAFGVLWFFIALSVESSAVPLPMLINEYRLYLPSAGAFTALSAGSVALATRLRTMRWASFAMAAAVVVMAFATYGRNSLWQSRVGLWEDAARKSPLKLRPHMNLGLALYEAGAFGRAIEEFNEAVSISPSEWRAHLNLGLAYAKAGQRREAIGHYIEALKGEPASLQALNNLGALYLEEGLADEAIGRFREALRLDPGSLAVRLNLGRAYLRKGLAAEAEAEFKAAVALRPGSMEARQLLEGLRR